MQLYEIQANLLLLELLDIFRQKKRKLSKLNKCLFFFWLYNTVLVLPYINMNPPRAYMSFLSQTPVPPPSSYHPSGLSQCTSPNMSIFHFCYIRGWIYHDRCLQWLSGKEKGHSLSFSPWDSRTRLKRIQKSVLMNRREEIRSMDSWWSWKFRKALEDYPHCLVMPS